MLCNQFLPKKAPMLCDQFLPKKDPMLCVKFSPKKPPLPMLSVKIVPKKGLKFSPKKAPPMLSVKFVPNKGLKFFLWVFRFLTWELGLEVSSRELKKFPNRLRISFRGIEIFSSCGG